MVGHGIDLRPWTWAGSTPSIRVIFTEMFTSSHALRSASITSAASTWIRSARSKAVTLMVNFVGAKYPQTQRPNQPVLEPRTRRARPDRWGLRWGRPGRAPTWPQ